MNNWGHKLPAISRELILKIHSKCSVEQGTTEARYIDFQEVEVGDAKGEGWSWIIIG